MQKKNLPVSQLRRYLEPGPVILITTAWKDEINIMTMAWQTALEFTPSLVGLMISSGSHTFQLLKKSKECVINIPTVDMIDTVIGIGTSTGATTNKFNEFKLTQTTSSSVKAPGIKECYANFECKLYDGAMINKYNLFIMECVKARVNSSPKYPATVHYRGNGVFMHSGKNVFHSERLKEM